MLTKFAIKSKTLKGAVNTAPELPGCYIYRDNSGKVLYVGKAINLRKRVKSYFQRFGDQVVRIQNMIKQISSVEFVVADNDLEAFILETNLIRKYKPKYNVDKKDDKNYSWVMISGGKDFPKIDLVRKRIDQKAVYFGPYAKQSPIKRTLESLRKIFPYRTCDRVIEYRKDVLYSSNPRPCLYWHLGLCDAPCAGKINSKEYKKNIKKIELFFIDKKKNLIEKLKVEMFKLSQDKHFEEAALLRDKVADLIYLSTQVDIEESTDEFKFRQVKKANQNQALEELVKSLPMLGLKSHKGFKIECYDISNIQGKYATGSMVVFVDGVPDKAQYRKFRIKTKGTPDDYAMHMEVQSRRLKQHIKPGTKTDKSFAELPDLMIIDGGKGQLASVLKVHSELGISIPVTGLAKKFEDLFLFNTLTSLMDKVTLPRNSQARYLIQRIRDESHRFAITYHKKLRSKASQVSILDGIPGVGEVIKKKLLLAFGSVENIKSASLKDIQQIVKNRTTAGKIKSKIP
ncbi:MAG: excinuclease ABC subunit UvrC [Desulfobacterales bacterium]|nr:excinuclease ABC subunit UvrC [Desulfobacterales bacterium]